VLCVVCCVCVCVCVSKRGCVYVCVCVCSLFSSSSFSQIHNILKKAIGNGTLIEALESHDRFYCVRKRDAAVTVPRPIKKGEFKQTYTLLPNKVPFLRETSAKI